MQIISDLNYVDTKAWDDFVYNHPHGNIFQTPEMIRVFENTKYYIPIVYLAIEGKEIKGILTGVIQKEYNGLIGRLSSRCIIMGGPLVKNGNPEIVELLLKKFDAGTRKKAIYSQFRNLFNTKDLSPVFLNVGYDYEEHLDIHIDLRQSFDTLKPHFHNSRLKNYNKSLNKGVLLKELTSVEDIEQGYMLVRRTYRRIKLPFPDFSHFKAITEILIPRQYCLCYGLYFNGEPIGFRMVLTYKKIIYDYFAGSCNDHSNKYPNDYLIIEILKYGCTHDFDYFDFGGAGKPGIKYGVRDYKLQFSDNLVELGRYQKIYKPLLYKTARLGLKIWKKFN